MLKVVIFTICFLLSALLYHGYVPTMRKALSYIESSSSGQKWPRPDLRLGVECAQAAKVPVDARLVGSQDLWAAGAVAGMALREGREGRLLRSTGRTINRPFLDHGREEMLHCWQ